MAPGKSRPRHSLYWNLFPGSAFPFPSPALSCNPTPAPVPAPALALPLVPIPAPTATNELFKQFMKAYLETNQGPKQPPAERKQSLKAKVPEIYYGKLHIDCYHFCQRCENYFETARATGTNWTPFATFFFWGNISVRWTLYKRCHQGEQLISIIWIEFKVFL